MQRRFPCGAEVLDGGVHFRVWAPKCAELDLVLQNKFFYKLDRESDDYFSLFLADVPPGTLYNFRINKSDDRYYPDPASRFQPLGPHGASQIVDPFSFQWSDQKWPGVGEKSSLIIYELHIGTFTPEGSWRSAQKKLQYLKELGINVIEMMPVNDFCGRFNWGYDGVNLFAPTHNYGNPDDLRAFIDYAHFLNLSVILDVVYNHFGPDGNYLGMFADDYLKTEATEWGQGINFDGANSGAVREYFLSNAAYWIEEFHFDGIRFDACHAIQDKSHPHILAEITSHIRRTAGNKKIFVSAENEQQQIHFTLPKELGGYHFDAVWNEDFHHTAYVRLTGRHEAYYSDYRGKPQEFISSIKHGFLYQGQWYSWQKKRRGSISRKRERCSLINFLENHDQVANSGRSARLITFAASGCYRALTALLLLSPQIPLLFQGQEYGSTTPFYYFSEQNPELAIKVFEGRIAFIEQFESVTSQDIHEIAPPPHDEETFLQSKLNWKEKERNDSTYNLFKDLIYLRKNDPVFSRLNRAEIDGAVLNEETFLLRYTLGKYERLLLFNLGIDTVLDPAPEPLLAPALEKEWSLLWCSEKTEYGGSGYRPIPQRGNWPISGHAALIFS